MTMTKKKFWCQYISVVSIIFIYVNVILWSGMTVGILSTNNIGGWIYIIVILIILCISSYIVVLCCGTCNEKYMDTHVHDKNVNNVLPPLVEHLSVDQRDSKDIENTNKTNW